MSFDVAEALRRLKPEKKTGTLQRRNDSELLFVPAEPIAGPPLLLDTTVYIDTLQGRLPAEVGQLLRVRPILHSAVALAELTHVLGRLDPAHHQTVATRKAVQSTIAGIPAHRLQAPGVAVMGEAGILAGVFARVQGLDKRDGQALLNDALLFLQALAAGCHLLTRNIGDMDRLQQLQPQGQVLFYRQTL